MPPLQAGTPRPEDGEEAVVEKTGKTPELGEAAVEEVMRVTPTVTWVTREVVEGVEFRGVHFPAGSILQVLCHAAGTDPRRCPS